MGLSLPLSSSHWFSFQLGNNREEDCGGSSALMLDEEHSINIPETASSWVVDWHSGKQVQVACRASHANLLLEAAAS